LYLLTHYTSPEHRCCNRGLVKRLR